MFKNSFKKDFFKYLYASSSRQHFKNKRNHVVTRISHFRRIVDIGRSITPLAVHVKFQPLRRGLSAFPARIYSSWENLSREIMCFRSLLHRRKEIFLVVLLFFLLHVILDDSEFSEESDEKGGVANQVMSI